MITVKFRKDWGRYVAGNTYKINREIALRAINLGLAEFENEPIEKPKRKYTRREKTIKNPTRQTRGAKRRKAHGDEMRV